MFTLASTDMRSQPSTQIRDIGILDLRLEAVVLPFADVDRANSVRPLARSLCSIDFSSVVQRLRFLIR